MGQALALEPSSLGFKSHCLGPHVIRTLGLEHSLKSCLVLWPCLLYGIKGSTAEALAWPRSGRAVCITAHGRVQPLPTDGLCCHTCCSQLHLWPGWSWGTVKDRVASLWGLCGNFRMETCALFLPCHRPATKADKLLARLRPSILIDKMLGFQI